MRNNTLKKLFLLDGIGAIVSAFLLGIVLVKFEKYFGIPKSTLYFLAVIPCLFAIFDFYCYFKIEINLVKKLKAIAIINILYCFLSIGFAWYHFKKITVLGFCYIAIEVILILAIVILELRAVKNYEKILK